MCGDYRKNKPAVRRRFMYTFVNTHPSLPVFSHVIDEEKEIAEMQRKRSTVDEVADKRAFWRRMRGGGCCIVKV